ncbi:MAG TPA: hypothetical protein VE046_08315 [Steroidobacteraceae bacterium]|nr:hypothetical protein [Steroidobacteraceae bacterium]
MKLYGADGKELMTVTAIEREGSTLVVKGKIFGTMPLTAKLRPEEARKAFGLLGLRKFCFLLTLPFRRSKS